MNNDFFADLYEANLIVIPRNLTHRKKQELAALEKLKYKDDFLSRYNVALRHLFLKFLERGFDIPNPKVHLIFKIFCTEVININKCEINQIINSRHSMKYKNIEPSYTVIENLERATVAIKFCNYQNHVI